MFQVNINWFGESFLDNIRLTGKMNLQAISTFIPYPDSTKAQEFDNLLAGRTNSFNHIWEARGGHSWTQIAKV